VTSEKSTAWVVKKSEDEIVAFSPQCPHLGCAVRWVAKKNEFLCTGPAQRPLDRFEVKVEDQKLLLGSVRRSEEADL